MMRFASRAASLLPSFLLVQPTFQFSPVIRQCVPLSSTSSALLSSLDATNFDTENESSVSDESNFDVWTPSPPRPQRYQGNSVGNYGSGSSWMDKNQKFGAADSNDKRFLSTKRNTQERKPQPVQNFRENFRGTRVFVQKIPPDIAWQDLKDHFRQVGEVVFASVSTDQVTGQSKGHGIVQFETTEMASRAIAEMRNYPLNGATLYVREDVQEDHGKKFSRSAPRDDRRPTRPTKWSCADKDALEDIDQIELKKIHSLIKERDNARRVNDYGVSDKIREELKLNHMVHVDDRAKIWWVSTNGKFVPQSVRDNNGDGRWGAFQPWRQIPTTPENDACVDSNLVHRLLKRRDAARREKDFKKADKLLEQATSSPDGDLNLRVHDDSRTWRIWTVEPPKFPKNDGPFKGKFERRQDRRSVSTYAASQKDFGLNVGDECIAFVERVAPEKVPEVRNLLEQFPGKERAIYAKVKQRFQK